MMLFTVGLSCSCRMPFSRQNLACFKRHCIDVEVAQKESDLLRGLQARGSLRENTGMLFIFPQSGLYNFWMKDTLIPLDIIWLDEGKNVIHVASHVLPCRKDPCPTYGPLKQSRYVLEINAGDAAKLNIHPGDRARFILSK